MSRSTEATDKEQQLEAMMDVVWDREEAFQTACLEYADAESEYRVRFSKAYLEAEGTEKARNAEAIIKVEKLLRERDRTEAVKDFTFQKLKDAQSAVSARQSLLNADTRTNKSFA
jgi:hypothetical protein